ncbi:MAG TPA: hypothetical protein VK785_00005, partial [Opitutaceae bacterium]|nr:hypothetical protein [Opitutaceae bacterium]
MNDWLQQLIDWTRHQDYGWFIASLMWGVVVAGAWGRGNRREGREGWLIWLAAANVIESAIQLALSANNYRAPYFGWDFALGLIQAVGIAALWWPLAVQVVPERPQLWRVMTVTAAAFLGVARIYEPVYGGVALALASAGGAWAVMRSAAAVRVLGRLPPLELRRMRLGLLLVALLPIVSTFGPLAYALGDGRRWVDFSPFELVSAAAHIIAAGFLGAALWAQRLRATPDTSESTAQRWNADLRLGFTILVVWLVVGVAIAEAFGRQAQGGFEKSLLLRARTAAALLDQTALRVALGPDFKLGRERTRRLTNGHEVQQVYVPWTETAPFTALRLQLRRLRKANADTVYIQLAVIRDGKVILSVIDSDPEKYKWRNIYRDATP